MDKEMIEKIKNNFTNISKDMQQLNETITNITKRINTLEQTPKENNTKPVEDMKKTIATSTKKAFVESNLKAFDLGLESAQ